MHIQVSADGETGTLIFCVESSMLLSQHETKIIRTLYIKYIRTRTMKMSIAAAPVVHTIRSCFVSTTNYRFNASLTQTPNNSLATLPSWPSPHACYAYTISQVSGRKERVSIDMCGSKQSCHELQYSSAENSNINKKITSNVIRACIEHSLRG